MTIMSPPRVLKKIYKIINDIYLDLEAEFNTGLQLLLWIFNYYVIIAINNGQDEMEKA